MIVLIQPTPWKNACQTNLGATDLGATAADPTR